MARTRVTLDHAGIRALLKSDGVRSDLARRADAVATAARASAPVASGAYRESIRRSSATTDRAIERVTATAPHAMVVESRTGNLARALHAAGGA